MAVVAAHDKYGSWAIKRFLASLKGAYQFGVPTEAQAKEDLAQWLTGVSVEQDAPVNRCDYDPGSPLVVEFLPVTRLTLRLQGYPPRGAFERYKDVTLCGYRVLLNMRSEDFSVSVDGLTSNHWEVTLEPRGTCPSCGVHKHAEHELAECSIPPARLP